MLPAGTKRRRCVILTDGTAIGCFLRNTHETHIVILEPSGHAYSYLQPDGTRTRHLAPTALSSHRALVIDTLNLRNRFTSMPPYVHLRLLDSRDVRYQRRIRSMRARWPAPGSNGGKLSVAKLYNREQACFEMQSIEGAAKVRLDASGQIVDLYFLVEVKVSDGDVEVSEGEEESDRRWSSSSHAHYTTLHQSFAIDQVPESFALPVRTLLAAKTAWDRDRDAEIDYLSETDEKKSASAAVSVLPRNAAFTARPAFSALNHQQSVLTGSNGYFTWCDESGGRQQQFTRETIPPTSVIGTKVTSHSVLSLCQHVDYVLQSFKYATTTDLEDMLTPPPLPTEELELAQEVENERGRFRAFHDGRVRVAFADRTILQVDRDGETCSFFFSDGASGQTTLASAPPWQRVYIHEAMEFGDWAFASREERMRRHVRRQETQAIVAQELQRISVRCGMNDGLEMVKQTSSSGDICAPLVDMLSRRASEEANDEVPLSFSLAAVRELQASTLQHMASVDHALRAAASATESERVSE
ncbi:hypothetical protein BBJ28_00011992 [Nothophytophthora sp. Chile5]|nr:hypothetical protein BBJ28_00011992 [Nothophytophthora sp. Chile5]